MAMVGGWWLGSEADLPSATRPEPVRPPAAVVDPGRDHASTVPTGTTADVFLRSPGLRHRLEATLLDAGEPPTPQALRALLPSLVARHFAPGEQVRALALLERYVGYRVALGDIAPPRDPSDPQALRRAIEARQGLRERHFDAEERGALFGAEDALDRYTLARLEIERHPSLTAQQKEQALRQAQDELPADQRAAREEALAHLQAQAETARFQAQGLGEAQRHAARSARHGEDAALRLSALDRDEAHWQARLAQYAQALAGGAPAATLEALRQQLFTPEEQLRLDGALALRAAAAAPAAR